MERGWGSNRGSVLRLGLTDRSGKEGEASPKHREAVTREGEKSDIREAKTDKCVPRVPECSSERKIEKKPLHLVTRV